MSRTFALTIPVLPGELRDSVCCAYLLCRIADTIEDRADLDDARRAALFDTFSGLLVEPDDDALLARFATLWPKREGSADDAAYQPLMRQLAPVIVAHASLTPRQRAPINDCVLEMIDGMRLMVRKPPERGVLHICSDLEELERYCHYVAGTVGLMLTQLFADHLGAGSTFSADAQREHGHRFGLGLQLTNILKDHRVDLSRNVSFFPAEWLDTRRSNGTPAQGLLPQYKHRLVERTLEHLEAAHLYTLALPPEPQGLRLFCLWALWMSAATMREVACSTAPHPKISRAEVGEIVSASQRHVADDAALEAHFRRYVDDAREAAALLAGDHLHDSN
ncbi:MAG: squalene/phytoene synthase family protein [Myxococcales bacterium]|nr:squalene/phytoene synthase family protein [Myxococcales bacterium]